MASDTLSTGLQSLDQIINGSGIPRGHLIEIFGTDASGKTALALKVIAEAQKHGCVCAFIDTDNALDIRRMQQYGIQKESFYFSQPDTAEKALAILEELSASGAIDVIVLDSVASLLPRAEKENSMGKHHYWLQSNLLSRTVRVLLRLVGKNGAVIIFVNQLRYDNKTVGGKSLKTNCSLRLNLKKIGETRDGSRIEITTVKNMFAPPRKRCIVDMSYQKGF